jgi:hypothetical protein
MESWGMDLSLPLVGEGSQICGSESRVWFPPREGDRFARRTVFTLFMVLGEHSEYGLPRLCGYKEYTVNPLSAA